MKLSQDDQMNLKSGIAAFETRNFSQAMQMLYPLAEAGEAEAQFRVAIMCQNGLGVVRKAEEAQRWMEAAAQQGNALAQHGLGFMFMEGDCTPRSAEQAVFWLEKAAEQGLAGSMTTLAMLLARGAEGLEPDREAARQWYEKAGFDPSELDALLQ